eukprot:Plantae.Rhodophyta-Rhodochaete_pulchella.ctg3213.p2 GENE.Plantae.Rhodophyta-Rhodochaete_pulchella.ctg3213~~Plantae.Rhodophyta-Rhodochaete_pulchella.ctg3213.p2  ORF type:complete len:545 (-),score=84.19 Plantae.Rhodophyta-Rhodochaete_pulchella.ctg3213:2320-3825(-)
MAEAPSDAQRQTAAQFLDDLQSREPRGYPWFQSAVAGDDSALRQEQRRFSAAVTGVLAKRPDPKGEGVQYLVVWSEVKESRGKLAWISAAVLTAEQLQHFRDRRKEEEAVLANAKRVATAGSPTNAANGVGDGSAKQPSAPPLPSSENAQQSAQNQSQRRRKPPSVLMNFDLSYFLQNDCFKDSFEPRVISGPVRIDENIVVVDPKKIEEPKQVHKIPSYLESGIWDKETADAGAERLRNRKDLYTVFKGIFSAEAKIFVPWKIVVAKLKSQKPAPGVEELLSSAGVQVPSTEKSVKDAAKADHEKGGAGEAAEGHGNASVVPATAEDIPTANSLPPVANTVRLEGNYQYKHRKFLDALASYDKALKYAPDSALLWSNRTAVNLTLKRFDEAVADATRAVRLAPRWPAGWIRLGAALKRNGSLLQAYRRYRYAIALAGQDPEAQWVTSAATLRSELEQRGIEIPGSEGDDADAKTVLGKRDAEPVPREPKRRKEIVNIDIT